MRETTFKATLRISSLSCTKRMSWWYEYSEGGTSSWNEGALQPGALPRTFVSAEIDIDKVKELSHTKEFDTDEFVVTRRDTVFPIQLKSYHKLKVNSATLVYEEGKEVTLQIVKQNPRFSGASLEVRVPADTPVTLYMLKITGVLDGGDPFSVELKRRVVVLFNAWSRNDGVYLEDENWRQEYVLNSSTYLYIGDKYGSRWNLALYQPSTLKAVLYIFETISKLKFEDKRDPILVSREMSALVNVQDDNGVLHGRWDGNYDDGKSPGFWTGSGAILNQYFQSGGEPVKYGQCWVFSGVLLTVLRILGIPSRSVTNFNSAHDTNRNRTIDRYFKFQDGMLEEVSYLTTGDDSIWNFHVWNEVWMSRPDLPKGFGGWQAVDATPQEESPQGGGYRTGPASLKAIRDGNSLGYDTNFVIAEVNADIKKFIILEEDKVPRLFDVDTETVGRSISTKQAGSRGREDITHQYKYAEGTDWERRALYHGYKELMEEVHDVQFTIPEVEYDFGQDVTLEVKVLNKGRQHQIVGSIKCQAVTYTGKIWGDVDSMVVEIKVNKGKSEVISMIVNGQAFSAYPGTKVYLKFNVLLAVSGTSQIFSKTVSLSPKRPKLEISGPDKLTLGKMAKLLISFKNPLPVEMKDIILNIDVDNLSEKDIVQTIGTIGANAEFKYALDIKGLKVGTNTVVVGLSSDKVDHVTGEKEVEVVKSVVETSPIPIDMLEIDSVDLDMEDNRRAHHTLDYEYPGLVVRRGQTFNINLTTTKPLPRGAKVVTRAVFQMVSKSIFKRTAFEVHAVASTHGRTIKFKLTPPADVNVGEYDLLLTVDEGGLVSVLHQNIKLVILFNPWCVSDTCHYHNTAHLEEYVLNTRGRIWVGSSTNNFGRRWQFSQFKKDSLEVALWIMDHMDAKERGNPVTVIRHISAMANVQDDDGILVGNWSGDYSDGTSPSKWTGSAAIMAEFNKTKTPVKYGQCWVFSGVLTTLYRCLGIPARSITNFNSAHDTDFNRAIDKFFDEYGDLISSDDSIWNFHVWNEVWMSRPDLPGGFSGWQVVDATPQEESPQGGGYRLGPAPREAVKLGQRMNYDVEFVISEVNADIRYYTTFDDGTEILSRINTTHVGKRISTKAIKSNRREDVTLDYKFKEGSTSERAALLAETESEKQIGVELVVQDDVLVGQNFTVTATVTNKTVSSRKLKVRLYGSAVMYTGASGQLVKSTDGEVTLEGGQSKIYTLNVVDSDYLHILEDGNFINFVCMVLDKKHEKSIVKTEDFRLKTPDISISLPEGGLKLYQPAEIKVSFTNPLRRPLRDGKFTLEGDGFVQDTSVDVPMVYTLNDAEAVLKTIPVKAGEFELLVHFSSNALADISGDVDAEVVTA